MASLSSCKGLLFVLVEVGDTLPDHEFQDWYNNEHVPLRTALPGFGATTRLVQTDGQTPTWAALYDLESVDYLKTEAYTRLAKTRSAREEGVLKRIAFLERRMYTLNEGAPTTASKDFAGYAEGEGPLTPTTLIAVSVDVPPEHEAEFHRWYDEEHVPLLRKVPGWLRTRRFILTDSGVTGMLPGSSEYKQPLRFLALHDYSSPDGLDGPEWKAATSTPWRDKIFANVKGLERLIFKVYKTFTQ